MVSDGLLVGFGRPDEIAEAIRRLLGDAALRHDLGEAGRAKVVERFTWDHVYQRLKAVYEQLLDAQARSAKCLS